MKKQFLILFTFISVLALSQVPQRFNKVIVTGDITSPKFIKTGSNADSVLLGNGSARAISTIKTDTVSLSNRLNAKATGNGTANGTNTGDETLTSIKTKLGAATPVSDGYLRYQDFADFSDRVSNATHTGDVTGSTALTLATVNSNVGTFNNVTINAKGLATAGSNVSYEPSFTKRTGFNKNFGTTTGTVLEGRTFGTAASSAVGDFQPIENQRLSATSSVAFNLVTTNSTSSWYGLVGASAGGGDKVVIGSLGNLATIGAHNSTLNGWANLSINQGGGNVSIGHASDQGYKLAVNGQVAASSFYGSGSNLTGVQLPITLTTNGTSGAATFSGNVLNVPNYNASSDVYQERTTVNGSTSGYMICSMPFRTGVYKKVLIRTNSLNGSATYTFPTSFLVESGIGPYYSIHTTGGSVTVSSFTRTSITLSSAVDFSAYIVVEGY